MKSCPSCPEVQADQQADTIYGVELVGQEWVGRYIGEVAEAEILPPRVAAIRRRPDSSARNAVVDAVEGGNETGEEEGHGPCRLNKQTHRYRATDPSRRVRPARASIGALLNLIDGSDVNNGRVARVDNDRTLRKGK